MSEVSKEEHQAEITSEIKYRAINKWLEFRYHDGHAIRPCVDKRMADAQRDVKKLVELLDATNERIAELERRQQGVVEAMERMERNLHTLSADHELTADLFGYWLRGQIAKLSGRLPEEKSERGEERSW